MFQFNSKDLDQFKFRSRSASGKLPGMTRSLHQNEEQPQETAVDALKRALASGDVTPAQILRMARVDRVQTVMRPYLEALS